MIKKSLVLFMLIESAEYLFNLGGGSFLLLCSEHYTLLNKDLHCQISEIVKLLDTTRSGLEVF